jgi:hypothetical protein
LTLSSYSILGPSRSGPAGTQASSLYSKRPLDQIRSSSHTLPFSRYWANLKAGRLEIHRSGFQPDEDYRVDAIESWCNDPTAHSRRLEEIPIINPSDYLRLTAWVFESEPSHFLRAESFGYGRLLRDQRVGVRRLAKALKKAASDLSPAEIATSGHEEFIITLSDRGVQVRHSKYLSSGQMQLRSHGLPSEILAQLLAEPEDDGLEAFEEMFNSGASDEREFQSLFENYPKLLMGSDYRRVVPQPILLREEEANLIPDFILVPHAGIAPKILDLKRPDASIFRSDTSREGFLSSVLKARDQLLEYKNYFNSRAAAAKMREVLGVDLYLPKIAVVVGRSQDFPSAYDRGKADARVPDLEVITYDDLAARARRVRARPSTHE